MPRRCSRWQQRQILHNSPLRYSSGCSARSLAQKSRSHSICPRGRAGRLPVGKNRVLRKDPRVAAALVNGPPCSIDGAGAVDHQTVQIAVAAFADGGNESACNRGLGKSTRRKLKTLAKMFRAFAGLSLGELRRESSSELNACSRLGTHSKPLTHDGGECEC
jgi:hypothetical protein